MSHRQPAIKNQAEILRSVFCDKGLTLGSGESLELASRLNGFPSWNVAKKATEDKPSSKHSEPKSLPLLLWTVIHRHRHGEDFFHFDHLPSDEECIATIEAESSWEPEMEESFEIQGPGSFSTDRLTVFEVNMAVFGYETPETQPEWQWVQRLASFAHVGNGEVEGVWEFMVNAERLRLLRDQVPETLKSVVNEALNTGAEWVMFHQG